MSITTKCGVVAGSNWDSGQHLNFTVGVKDDSLKYNLRRMDEVLTKDQITAIEATLAALVSRFITVPEDEEGE